MADLFHVPTGTCTRNLLVGTTFGAAQGPTSGWRNPQPQVGGAVCVPSSDSRRRGRTARKVTHRPARTRSTPTSPTSSADPASPLCRAWTAPNTTRAAKRTSTPPATPRAILTRTQPVNQQGGFRCICRPRIGLPRAEGGPMPSPSADQLPLKRASALPLRRTLPSGRSGPFRPAYGAIRSSGRASELPLVQAVSSPAAGCPPGYGRVPCQFPNERLTGLIRCLTLDLLTGPVELARSA